MQVAVPMPLFFRRPWIACVLGVFAGLVIAMIGSSIREESLAFEHGQVAINLAAAAPDTPSWVVLKDARPHCEQAVATTDGKVYLPLTDPGGVRHVIAQYPSNTFECGAVSRAPITGLLRAGDSSRVADLAKEGVNLDGQPSGERVPELCTTCSAADSRSAAIFCLYLGLAMFAFGPLWWGFTLTPYGRRSSRMYGVEPTEPTVLGP